MKKVIPLLIALCTASGGCAYYTTDVNGQWDLYSCSVRNLTETPVQWVDEIIMASRNSKRADEAWAAVRKASPEQPFSSDYAAGFRAGFGDYLDAGGNGEPPAVPPFCYRLSCYQTANGHAAIDDWYAGFRHGAAVAKGSAVRENLVIPLSAPPVGAYERRPSLSAGPPPQQPPYQSGQQEPVIPDPLPFPKNLPGP